VSPASTAAAFAAGAASAAAVALRVPAAVLPEAETAAVPVPWVAHPKTEVVLQPAPVVVPLPAAETAHRPVAPVSGECWVRFRPGRLCSNHSYCFSLNEDFLHTKF
jgi:hypothetical protein